LGGGTPRRCECHTLTVQRAKPPSLSATIDVWPAMRSTVPSSYRHGDGTAPRAGGNNSFQDAAQPPASTAKAASPTARTRLRNHLKPFPPQKPNRCDRRHGALQRPSPNPPLRKPNPGNPAPSSLNRCNRLHQPRRRPHIWRLPSRCPARFTAHQCWKCSDSTKTPGLSPPSQQ
jgi:hypothetical protein